ncbi:alpha/beta hydrolase [Cohnella candidum]|uniref:Alpha/beta hydrolase n=1 Tax=Cohnella candidum TaxID=2674991 RepID=A0A3G3JTL3_9BACL|nr:alpha/beta hydrolase [Cohnella candidum]AYQ71556.1 alpha/beta hydrolase [Cohnella candidum]
MLSETIQLWDGRVEVRVQSYILNDSKEFQSGVKRPAVIICPGGAYLGTSDREAEPVALKFASKGYHAFVLRYTTYFKEWVTDFRNPPPSNPLSVYPQPLLDLGRTIAMIRENAEQWNIDSDRIAVAGFSAGGHLAASLGVHWHESWLGERLNVDNTLLKPNALVLGYALLDYVLMREETAKGPNEMMRGLFEVSNRAVFGKPDPSTEELIERSPAYHVNSNTPPTFLWHTAEDDGVFAQNSLHFAIELAKNKIPYELHVFEKGPHGLSLSDETTAAIPEHLNPHAKVWFDTAISWLSTRMSVQ